MIVNAQQNLACPFSQKFFLDSVPNKAKPSQTRCQQDKTIPVNSMPSCSGSKSAVDSATSCVEKVSSVWPGLTPHTW